MFGSHEDNVYYFTFMQSMDEQQTDFRLFENSTGQLKHVFVIN